MSTEPGKQQSTAPPISSSALRRLLDELQCLMLEIRRRVCEDRRRYLASHSHSQAANYNVSDIINRYIAANSRVQDASKATGQHGRTTGHESPASLSADHAQPQRIDPTSARNRELAEHFHRSGQVSALPSPLAERFRHSAWDHIHAAIRLANAHDVEGARLHAQLADNALKEAARYMEAPAYQQFIDEFETSLEQMANNPGAVD